MFKVAVPDPVQKKLRQDKKLWNDQIKLFIKELIEFKKTMNGTPSKFFPQKGTIKEPIPANPLSLLSKLTTDFQGLAEGGSAIVEEQINYAKTRRRPRPKGMQPPTAPTPATPATPAAPATPPVDLSKQLAASRPSDKIIKLASRVEGKYDLSAEASNPLTRFFARLTNLPIGFSQAAEMRRLRMSMLTACVKVYKNLEKLQVHIVRKSDESIDDAWAVFNDDIWKNWNMVRKSFETYKGFLPKGVPDAGGPIKTPAELAKIKEKEDEEAKKLEKKMDQVDQAEQSGKPGPDDAGFEQPPGEEVAPWDAGAQGIIDNTSQATQLALANRAKSDFLTYFKKLPLQPGSYVVADAMNELLPQSATPDSMRAAAPQFIRQHAQLVYDLNNMFGTSGKSIQEIYRELEARRAAEVARLKEQQKLIQQKPALVAPTPAPPPEQNKAVDQLEATAQAFLKKWIGKTRHQLSFLDNTSAPRLNVYKVAKEARKTVDQVMDHLEKDLKVETMDPLVKSMNAQLDNIRGVMVNLHQLRTVEKKKQKAAK